MKKKIEIINSELDNSTLKLTEDTLIEIINKIGSFDALDKYDIPNDFILKNINLFDKLILINSNHCIDENLFYDLLKIDFLDLDDLKDLNMLSYSTFSKKFIKNFSSQIDWSRMMIYVLSEDSVDVKEYIDIIENNNLWWVISSNELSIDFIREYKDKLDWRYLKRTNVFTDEQKEEFSKYLEIPDRQIYIKNTEELEADIMEQNELADIKNKFMSVINNGDDRFE